MIKILFVCHGNICRSPMAEFVMKDLIKKAGLSDEFFIASAATSTEEIGNGVHYGTRKKLVEFGISVDGTIHYLAKYRQELQGTNWSIRSSAVLALQETGQSMIYNAIILFFGFGIFALSDFGGTVALGILVSITLLAAMLSNLILLPSLLLTLDKHTTNKTFQNPKILSEEENKKD